MLGDGRLLAHVKIGIRPHLMRRHNPPTLSVLVFQCEGSLQAQQGLRSGGDDQSLFTGQYSMPGPARSRLGFSKSALHQC